MLLECGWQHAEGQCLRLNGKGRSIKQAEPRLLLLQLQCNKLFWLRLPCQDGLHTQTESHNKPLLLLLTSLPLPLRVEIKGTRHHALPMAFFIKPDLCVIPSWYACFSEFSFVFLHSSHLLGMLFKSGVFAVMEMDSFCDTHGFLPAHPPPDPDTRLCHFQVCGGFS